MGVNISTNKKYIHIHSGILTRFGIKEAQFLDLNDQVYSFSAPTNFGNVKNFSTLSLNCNYFKTNNVYSTTEIMIANNIIKVTCKTGYFITSKNIKVMKNDETYVNVGDLKVGDILKKFYLNSWSKINFEPTSWLFGLIYGNKNNELVDNKFKINLKKNIIDYIDLLNYVEYFNINKIVKITMLVSNVIILEFDQKKSVYIHQIYNYIYSKNWLILEDFLLNITYDINKFKSFMLGLMCTTQKWDYDDKSELYSVIKKLCNFYLINETCIREFNNSICKKLNIQQIISKCDKVINLEPINIPIYNLYEYIEIKMENNTNYVSGFGSFYIFN